MSFQWPEVAPYQFTLLCALVCTFFPSVLSGVFVRMDNCAILAVSEVLTSHLLTARGAGRALRPFLQVCRKQCLKINKVLLAHIEL